MINHRAEAVIDLSKIRKNYEYIKELASGSHVMAVVKADAYGHGAAKVSSMLESIGCGYFAVACIDEAIELRESGIKGEILILGISSADDTDQLRKFNIIQTVDSYEYALRLSENGGARVHLKIDTGMSRLGMYCHSAEDIPAVVDEIKKIKSLGNIKTEGIFTHFADSDNPSSGFTEKQYALFTRLLGILKNEKIEVGICHCSNSAAIINYPYMRLDMVRAGIILYGLSPAPKSMKTPKLCPAMALKSRIASVHTLKEGDYVSYGCAYRAEKEIKAATISIGYADGFSRALSGKITVKINGKKVNILGRICMDLCVADVSDVECAPGDEAVIFDCEEDINTIADLLGTINYEVVCMLKKRVKNIYKE
jgi:alanine racemase